MHLSIARRVRVVGCGVMADQESKGEPIKDNKGADKRDSKAPVSKIIADYIHKFTASIWSSSQGNSVRLFLTLVGGILVALVLLWIVDKIVFYYFARSYVDQVADVFDLNEHLANALILLTFIPAVFFGRCAFSLSKQKRLFGIAGISALLIGHSLVLWYGTRNNYFDRSGTAIKCYVLTRDGKVTYGERPGVDLATGLQCRPVTPEMLERLKAYQTGKRPQQIMDSNPTFFDPRTGEPIVWYYRSKDNEIQLFDLMGFQPDTGDELIPITKDVVEEWKNQLAKQARRVPHLVDPQKYVFFDPLNGNPRAWYWQRADGGYEFYDSPGFQPQTGDQLKVATRDIVDAWKQYAGSHGNAPQLVDPNVYPFFDPVTGVAQVWYWRGDNGTYEFYNAPGYEPKTGDKLSIVTRDVVETWKRGNQAPGPTGLQLRQRTATFLDELYREISGPNGDALTAANDNYADQVNYYGKPYSRDQVIAELQSFDNRWPIRLYQIEQGSLAIDCDEQTLTCNAKGLLDFDSRSPDRNQRSSGVATFEYILKFASVAEAPKIIEEAGDVKVRNLEALSDLTPPLNGTWNGCPPNYTIQGGVCKPYQGGQNAITPQQQMLQGVIGGVLQHLGR